MMQGNGRITGNSDITVAGGEMYGLADIPDTLPLSEEVRVVASAGVRAFAGDPAVVGCVSGEQSSVCAAC